MTIAPKRAVGNWSKRPASSSIVSRTKAALISEAIWVRWPAASANGGLREAAVVDEAAAKPGGAIRDALRDSSWSTSIS